MKKKIIKVMDGKVSVEIRVFKTGKAMLAEAEKAGFPQPKDTKAFAHSHLTEYLSRDKKRVLRREYTRDVWFIERWIGGGVVAHEMAHMAFFILADQKVKSVPTTNAKDQQEPFCRLLQELVREFWNAYYKK